MQCVNITHHTLLFSDDKFNELQELLLRPKFDRYVARNHRHVLLALLAADEDVEYVAVHTNLSRQEFLAEDKNRQRDRSHRNSNRSQKAAHRIQPADTC